MTKIFSQAGERSIKWRPRPAAFYYIILFILLLNCSHDAAKQDNTIIYWSANNQYEQDLAKVIVAEWNSLHPETPVKHQPVPEGQSSEEVILAAVVGKSAPDVYSNMWPGDVQLYVNAKVLVPISDFADFDSTMNSRLKNDLLEEARSEDGVVLFRQYFQSIPQDLIDAARIDGCNELQIIFRIIWPNSIPTLITVGILTFMPIWNEVLWPLYCYPEN